MTDNNLFSTTLSSTRLDGFRFKFNRLIKHDYLLHALLLFILQVQYGFFSDCTFSVKKINIKKQTFWGWNGLFIFILILMQKIAS